jgi:hypothetical protein
MADIVPASVEPPATAWLGCMKGTLDVRGDIVGPTSDLVDWEALK